MRVIRILHKGHAGDSFVSFYPYFVNGNIVVSYQGIHLNIVMEVLIFNRDGIHHVFAFRTVSARNARIVTDIAIVWVFWWIATVLTSTGRTCASHAQ
jgi:hypothetical protein